ncbi:MAG: type II secretion system protein, partial [Patescibacteria group bacterium]|nr:type II secretion system protein [Patescibacteria group bacterium]
MTKNHPVLHIPKAQDKILRCAQNDGSEEDVSFKATKRSSTSRHPERSVSSVHQLADYGRPKEGSSRSSFTLIELLIVIAIIGILASALVLVLNPAQLLSQSRDSRRTQDLSNLNNAI